MPDTITLLGSLAQLDMQAVVGKPVWVRVHYAPDGKLLGGTEPPGTVLGEPGYAPTGYGSVRSLVTDEQGLFGGVLPWEDGGIYEVAVPGDVNRYLMMGTGAGEHPAGSTVNVRLLPGPDEVVTPSVALDAGVSALIDTIAGTLTNAALSSRHPRGTVNVAPMSGTGGATWETNTTRVGHPDLQVITGPAADALMVGGGHKGTDYTSTNQITSTAPLYRLMSIIGGYDSTLTDGHACTMLAPMHAHIYAGSTHAAIIGGSFQKVWNVDYGGAILGTETEVGKDGVAKSGWHAIGIGGKGNKVSADGGTTGGYPTIVNGIANTVRSTTTGDPGVNGGRYAAIVGGISNTNQGNASGQLAGQANRIGDDVVDAGSTGSHSGQVGGYTNKITTGSHSGQVGGYALVASGNRAGQLGGTSNVAAGLGTGTLGGQSNTVTGQYSGAVGGSSMDIQTSAHFAGSLGGSANTLTHRFTGALAGRDNTVSGECGVTLGGQYNTVATYGASASGLGARTRHHGAQAQAYGSFGANGAGDAQTYTVVVRREYAGTSAAGMLIDNGSGSTSHLALPNGSVWRFRADVVGKCATSGEVLGGTITGTIERGAGAATTTFVGTPVVASDSTNPAWTITAVADTGQGALSIRGTHGDAAKTVRWVARIQITELVY